jgi:hypothetical protein
MNKLIRLEEAAMLGICLYALYRLRVEWWFYILLVFGPDLSMLGYLAGNKAGAILYNLFHHKAVAVIIFMLGILSQTWILQVAGIILFGHSSMDRVFGYGLKYFKGFGYTHLGRIGPGDHVETDHNQIK